MSILSTMGASNRSALGSFLSVKSNYLDLSASLPAVPTFSARYASHLPTSHCIQDGSGPSNHFFRPMTNTKPVETTVTHPQFGSLNDMASTTSSKSSLVIVV